MVANHLNHGEKAINVSKYDDNSSVRSNEQEIDSFDSDDESIDDGTENEISVLLLSLNDDGK